MSNSPSIPEDEFKRRYIAHVVAAGFTAKMGEDDFEGAGFDAAREGYETDPEGAAAMSMSYWVETPPDDR